MAIRQRGSVMIEFALASSVLFLLLFSVLDYSRVFSTANRVTGAARAGAQWALAHPESTDLGGVEEAARAEAGSAEGLTVSASRFCTCSVGGPPAACEGACRLGSPSTYVEVKATLEFRPLAPYPLLPGTMPLSGRAVVRIR